MRNKNSVVKIIMHDDGTKSRYPKWHLIDPCNYQGPSTLCAGEFFGEGESACDYKLKIGVVTCKECILMIKTYQKIKI